jgi:hypothetical protein
METFCRGDVLWEDVLWGDVWSRRRYSRRFVGRRFVCAPLFLHHGSIVHLTRKNIKCKKFCMMVRLKII